MDGEPAPPAFAPHDGCTCVYTRSATGEYSEAELAEVRSIGGLDEAEVVDGWLVAHCVGDAATLKAAAATLAKMFPGRPVRWTSPGSV
jgi:hypothetical protein